MSEYWHIDRVLPELDLKEIFLRNLPTEFRFARIIWFLRLFMASLRDHPTNLKDSFEFIDQIRKIDNLHTKTLVSFDVKSLFTNIPVDFTIKLVLNQLFPDEQNKINGLSKNNSTNY